MFAGEKEADLKISAHPITGGPSVRRSMDDLVGFDIYIGQFKHRLIGSLVKDA